MVADQYKPSESVKTSEGRQYHIDLGPGELAEYILLSVDQKRAKRISESFDKVTLNRYCREIMTFTGVYKGIPISVIGTGIGQDNTEIIVVEAVQLFTEKKPTMIRVGSCGGLREEIGIGDLIVSTGAVRMENTSTYFVDEGYPGVAHYEVVLALITAADNHSTPYHVGLTASTSGFFGAQGREVGGLKSKDPDTPRRLAEWNVLNMEMECSTLFTLGSLAGVRTGCVCTAYSNRTRGEFISDKQRVVSDQAAEQVSLEAIRILAEMDRWKALNQKSNFIPKIDF